MKFEYNSIIKGDCIEIMKQIPDNEFDLAIADPPYNLSQGNNWKWDNSITLPGMGGNWHKHMENWDNIELKDLADFTLIWLSQIKRVVKPTGSFWVHGTYHNIGIINFMLQILEIEIINEVIWFKRNSFPNLSGRRLTASHETVLWAHTGKKREYLFNYETSKSMPCPGDNIKNDGKQMRTVWDISNNKTKEELAHGKHPAQKPIRLLDRMIKISACENAKILVPFAGSGSECVASKLNDCQFIGIEKEDEYIEIANKRLSSIQPTLV